MQKEELLVRYKHQLEKKKDANIVIFCEQHHDYFQNLVQEYVIDSVDKNKWQFSLFEGKINHKLTKNEKRASLLIELASFFEISVNEIDQTLLRNHDLLLKQQTPRRICLDIPNSYRIKNKFENSFISHDFDVNWIDEFEKNQHILENRCLDLDYLLDNDQPDESVIKLFFNHNDIEDQFLKRDAEIVTNLENIITELQANYTVGWAGSHHCEDFFYHLNNKNSLLLEKILFIHLQSTCTEIFDKGVEKKDLSIFFDYIKLKSLDECLDDNRVEKVIARFQNIFVNIKENNTTEGEEIAIPDRFLNDHFLNINLSLLGDSNSITPWDASEFLLNEVFK